MLHRVSDNQRAAVRQSVGEVGRVQCSAVSAARLAGGMLVGSLLEIIAHKIAKI